MKTKCLFVMAALVVSVASAGTVNLTMDNLAANGWKTTATYVWGGSTDATVTQTEDYGGIGNFRFYTGPMNTSWQFQWAGLSSDAFSGVSLASITSLKIKNYGVSGDNTGSWQPPTFTFVVQKDASNQRCITWKGWDAVYGNPREAGVWHEYDAATTGRWFVEETETYYSSLAALKAALPNAWFADDANLPLDWGYASQHAFNVGNCPLYDSDRAWFSGSRGYVDWFEVGINGDVTRYDLGIVPEPSSLALLAAGLGLLALRRRK